MKATHKGRIAAPRKKNLLSGEQKIFPLRVASFEKGGKYFQVSDLPWDMF